MTYLGNRVQRSQRWIILCQVIDNFGDAGVCWRLSRQLALEHGAQVELWIDDPLRAQAIGAASFVEPANTGSVTLVQWNLGRDSALLCQEAFGGAGANTANAVVAAFACPTPQPLLERMIGKQITWLNLEYLSAEPWVENSHLLTSPKDGLSETFFFPGFFPTTGGLLRERAMLALNSNQNDLPAVRVTEREHLLKLFGLATEEKQKSWLAHSWISLFCYPQAPIPQLVAQIRATGTPTLMIVPHGVGSKSIDQLELFAHSRSPNLTAQGACQWFCLDQLTVVRVPLMSQADYDRLLAQCELNLVRGEDSLVRAIWARRPFLWHVYPQEEQTHLVKLDAFVQRVLAPMPQAQSVIEAFAWWNHSGSKAKLANPSPLVAKLLENALHQPENPWQKLVADTAQRLALQTDLCTQLVELVDAGGPQNRRLG
jgi:uncharacterized repeat protein (TIGR03837 family)